MTPKVKLCDQSIEILGWGSERESTYPAEDGHLGSKGTPAVIKQRNSTKAGVKVVFNQEKSELTPAII